jgi:hypothetical protein
MTHKVSVVYNAKGEIKATAVAQHEHTRIHSPEGTQVHVVAHPGLEQKDMHGYLADLHRNHRVDVSVRPATLRVI